MTFVPVVDKNQKPLMPTKPSRARRWIKEGKATPFWKRGVFCVRLNVEPSGEEKQDIAVGIDPGSKKEGFTVKSESHTFLNIQADAVTWVKKHIEVRRMMRKNRRYRKTPCRKCRFNRKNKTFLSPSTKARWQWKLRISNWLCKMYPITNFIVEDIKAHTFGGRRWNKSFSPLEVGKNWFYYELSKMGEIETKQGYETKQMRDVLKLKKSKKKLSNLFEAHCVDSWVLANSYTGGHTKVDNKQMLFLIPLRFHRRQLHFLQFSKNGIRKRYGGTMSLGLKRGNLVKHSKYGLSYVGGYLKDRISLYSVKSGQRLCQNAKVNDCKILSYNSWRFI
jgi:hypothetical protein